MKKIISILLVLSLILTFLASCSNEGRNDNTSSQNPVDGQATGDAPATDGTAGDLKFQLIPAPQEIKPGQGCTVVALTVGGDAFENARKTLIDYSKRIHGAEFTEVGTDAGVLFTHVDGLNKEAYTLEIRAGKITVTASDEAGALNAVATIIQLAEAAEGGLELEECTIADEPDCEFRAVMVDLARVWHEPKYIYEYIDMCRFFKIRYLQLHFTDSQLYTLPSKAYPKLSTPGKSYTEAEIKSFIEYARLRGVSLIPEIEAPGHCGILQAAYPKVFGSDGIICQGAESFAAMETIFAELCELFEGSEYIHIGGDEATISLWLNCPKCLKTYRDQYPDFDKMTKDEKLAVMFAGFVNRMADVVFAHGMTPAVWEGFPEAANQYVSKDILVYSWENYYQTTPSLLKGGFNIVNASWIPMYIVTPATHWTKQEIYDWSIYRWQAIHPGSPYNNSPLVIEPNDQVKGGMLLAWGDNIIARYKNPDDGIRREQRLIEERVPFLAYNTWNPDVQRPSYDDFYKDTFLPVTRLYEKLFESRTPAAEDPKPNLALNAPVSTYLDNCYSEYGNAVANLTDGNRGTQFCTTLLAEYTDDTYDWIMVDLGEAQTVSRVTLVPVYDGNLGRYYMFPTDYEVQISADASEWKTVAEVSGYTCDTDEVVHIFDAQTARYVRIYVTGVDTSVHNPPMWFVYLMELEVS